MKIAIWEFFFSFFGWLSTYRRPQYPKNPYSYLITSRSFVTPLVICYFKGTRLMTSHMAISSHWYNRKRDFYTPTPPHPFIHLHGLCWLAFREWYCMLVAHQSSMELITKFLLSKKSINCSITPHVLVETQVRGNFEVFVNPCTADTFYHNCMRFHYYNPILCYSRTQRMCCICNRSCIFNALIFFTF